MQHSKGPWAIDNWDEVDEFGREYVDVLDADGVNICTVHDRDAALIAAAPEMLSAMEAVEKCGSQSCFACRKTIRAAIAKAKGKTP